MSRYRIWFDSPVNEEGKKPCADFYAGDEETARAEAMALYKEQFGDEASGKIEKVAKYRTQEEVKQFCMEKYGTAYPADVGFGHIVWWNVPYFAMPYKPSHMKSIPRLRSEDAEAGSHCDKDLTPEQLALLGIDFNPYEHGPYQGGHAYIKIGGRRMELSPDFGKIEGVPQGEKDGHKQ
jgi:hypothetical protein